MSITYYLYARKSTDVEDKQVRSIDDQLAVLRALAKEKGLNIAQEFVEKQSAKRPGRPVFAEMMSRLERGEAQGVVCWKIDRLARNPIDGGRISWLLQRGAIQHLQTHDRSFYPSDNVLLMSVEFGVANQYIVDLRANTMRGLREKARRGEYPSHAPIGYVNNPRTKLVDVNRKEAAAIRLAYERYAEGDWRLEDVSEFLAKHGIRTRGGLPLKRGQIRWILSNPFYCGFFKFAKELYEGKHKQIIPKSLFDRVQDALKRRSRSRNEPKNHPQAFCGLFRCGTCGMMITAEKKLKRQKNGNVHEYTYYRCTRKNKEIKCSEPPIREEELDRQLSAMLKEYAMPDEWAAELSRMADADERESLQSAAALVREAKAEAAAISEKAQRLLDAYLEQIIDREQYREEKEKLLSSKKSLEERIAEIEKGSLFWVEPLREWIKDAQMLGKSAESVPLSVKKSFAKKIFGLNPSRSATGLTLSAREARGCAKKQWAALAAAHREAQNLPLCSLVVEMGRLELPSGESPHDSDTDIGRSGLTAVAIRTTKSRRRGLPSHRLQEWERPP